MTIRKIWLLFLMLIAIISVIINTLVISLLTDRYFRHYVTKNYERHLEQIMAYSKIVLLSENPSLDQVSREMATHLIDPIIRISLFDIEGNLMAEVDIHGEMMRGIMGMHYEEHEQEISRFDLYDGDDLLAEWVVPPEIR